MRKVVLLSLLLLVPSSAFADITVFAGTNQTPSIRPARGFAVGIGLLVVGFEFEYSSSAEDVAENAPGLRTYMGNGLVQTPFAIAGFQPYATAGGGLYRETLLDESETSVGINMGFGAKVNLFGPLRMRFDYRYYRLRGSPRYPNPKRIYAGLNLKF